MNHGDAAPLTADGIVPASFLLRRARLKKKKIITLPFLLRRLFYLGVVTNSTVLGFDYMYTE